VSDPLSGTARSAKPVPAPQSGAQVVAAQVPGITALLSLAVGVVIIAGLFLGKDVLIPVTLAILLSFVLSPIVDLLRRWRVPKGVAVLVAVLSALGALGGIIALVGMQAASLADDAPRYAQTIEGKLAGVQRVAADGLARFERTPAAGPDVPAGTPPAAPAPEEQPRATAANPLPVQVVDAAPSVLARVGEYLSPVIGPFQTFIIVLVVAIFILMQREDLRDRLIRLFGSSDLHRTTVAMDDAAARLARYFLSQLAVNTGYGILVTAGLWLIGVPVPALWGIIAAILRFVPYVGSLLGSALPLIVAAGVDPGWTMVIWVLVLFLVLDPLLGYGIEPLLYGHSTGLSPLSVVLAAVFWTWVWGPVGLVLSMPLTLCLVVMGRHIPALEFLDVLLGDRPALSPVEGFYQRMLAEDPDEAIEQAERLLEERSLTAYYDEVALGALKLAAQDAARGAIDRDTAGRIVTSMQVLVDELADADDTAATSRDGDATSLSPVEGGDAGFAETARPILPEAEGEWRDEGAVLCLAGRGVLDDAVTSMMAQLMEKRGFGVRRVRHEAASRARIAELEVERAKLICISYLEIGGTPSHLRYLVRRVAVRAPGVPIMVGLWPEGEAALSDREIQRVLGADHYVGSLAQAVDVALDLARSPVADAA